MDAVVGASPPSVRIGELLLRRGLLAPEALEAGLVRQRILGDALGGVLASEGRVRPRDLYETLAEQQGLPFADLLGAPPDPALMRRGDADACLRHGCVPWKEEEGALVMACIRADMDEVAQAFIRRLARERPVKIALTTPRDVQRSVESAFGGTLDKRAREYLLRAAPHYSLRHVSGGRKGWAAVVAVLVSCMALCLWFPQTCLTLGLLLCNLFYLATMALKPWLFIAGRTVPPLPTPQMMAALPPERELPVYTVLVPLYREAESIPRLIRALRNLDYPATRLDIKLIVEEDDETTLRAIRAAYPPAMFEVLRVPYSLPRTKPKACNYALTFARGEYVTIYDAEDAPQPDQLRKAVAAFSALPNDVVCLQARLNYYNRGENLLTRMFAIEYGGLFDFMLPGLQALGIPIPLGGTSNHLRLRRLRELGEWDPYNVTEDADLGIRLATEGLRTMTFDSLTEEEAPVLVSSWLKQRSRWIKGYMQTWRVAMRRAPVLWARFGPVGFLGFQLFVGAASLVYLLSPLLWVFSALWALDAVRLSVLPDWAVGVSIGVFAVGVTVQWLLAAAVVAKSGWFGPSMAVATALYPFYWLLHSLASFRALWQIFAAPYHWDKTPHGLSRLIPS